MKKKVLVSLLAAGMLALSGCNYQLVDLKYKYNKAYITVGDKIEIVDVKAWCDYKDSDMVQVVATNGDIYYTSSVNAVLKYEKR